MAFDYKKECKEFYRPKTTPVIITIPSMNYLAVRGQGDPNVEDGEYQRAIAALYAVAYTIKMSRNGDHRIEGYFDYVVPPLEGLWWQEGTVEVDYARKTGFRWVSLIRLPDFVSANDVAWAIRTATAKKDVDCSGVGFLTYDEGECVQCMHLGPYDDEPATVARLHETMASEGYTLGITDSRRHHEIYLNDARRTAPDKLKTVIRLPIRKA